MSYLKECPFCKGVDIRFSNKTSAGGSNRHLSMYCNICKAYGPRVLIKVDKKYYSSNERYENIDQRAVEAWNNRGII